jgi:hypothetical protein
MNKGSLISGTFYGVVDAADNTTDQDEVYTDPLDIPEIDISVIEKTITENGTYSAEDDGYVGYSDVTVNVPLPQNAYLLKSVANLPQAIASFKDGADAPMKSLKVAIEPQQEGSGDPSPTNVRPISGRTEVNVSVSPNLLVGTNWKNEYFINSNGNEQANNLYRYTTNIISVKPSTTYYIQLNYTSYTELAITVPFYNENGSFIRRDMVTTITSQGTIGVAFTTPSNCYGLRVSIPLYSNSQNLQEGTSIVDGHTYTIDLDGTRYGVDLDVINGIGREYKEYPSYNGETLIGPWMSDRDAYAEGTTPTIGAQVVDKGDISTFNTIPTAVKSLRGVNNVYANTGDITDAEYFSKEV